MKIEIDTAALDHGATYGDRQATEDRVVAEVIKGTGSDWGTRLRIGEMITSIGRKLGHRSVDVPYTEDLDNAIDQLADFDQESLNWLSEAINCAKGE